MMPLCAKSLKVRFLSRSGDINTASVSCPSPSWTIYAETIADHQQTVLVATRFIPQGGRIDSQDTKLVRISVGNLGGKPAPMRQPLRMTASVPISANQPILLSSITMPVIVKNGQHVTVTAVDHGITITAQAAALQSGSYDQEIEVENTQSHAKLDAKIVRQLPHASGLFIQIAH
jgi:flagella basal body P-ring formation protein FlgA